MIAHLHNSSKSVHWYYQLLGDVGQVGQVNSSAVSKPAAENSLMTEIASEIQLLQKQTDTFDKHHHINQGISMEIFEHIMAHT